MKVKELIKLLQETDENYDILISSDPEGNSFSKFEDVSFDMHYEVYGEDVEIQSKEDYEDDCMLDEDDEPFEPNCIILWP
jgi:hypothetical protein